MKLSVDKKGDALRLSLDESPVAESKEVERGVVLTYNASNEVIGVEMLRLSERSVPLDMSGVEFQAADGSVLRRSLEADDDDEWLIDDALAPVVPKRRNPFLAAVSIGVSLLAKVLVATILFITDRLIDVVLLCTPNSRALPRTKRIRFPPSVRRALVTRQRGQCMYCRVRLHQWNTHIDHVYPAEHGGSNDIGNLQALCSGCNQRKGVQTDEEFRTRYRKLLPVRGRPRRLIEQGEFAAITAKTEQLESTRTRKRSVFRTQSQRIVSGSLTLGIIACVSSFVLLTMSSFADIQAILLIAPPVIGVGVVTGLIKRARRTGRMIDEA